MKNCIKQLNNKEIAYKAISLLFDLVDSFVI